MHREISTVELACHQGQNLNSSLTQGVLEHHIGYLREEIWLQLGGLCQDVPHAVPESSLLDKQLDLEIRISSPQVANLYFDSCDCPLYRSLASSELGRVSRGAFSISKVDLRLESTV